MAIYRGIGGVNRTVNKQYGGIGGVNREIAQQWRGIGGVNRQVFSSATYIYNAGQEPITPINRTIIPGATPSVGYTKNAGNIYVWCGPNNTWDDNTYFLLTQNQIDLTKYTKLKAIIDATSTNAGDYVWLIVRSSTTGNEIVAGTQIMAPNSNGITLTVDISGLTGSYYVGFCISSKTSSSKVTTTCYQMWLE